MKGNEKKRMVITYLDFKKTFRITYRNDYNLISVHSGSRHSLYTIVDRE